MIFALAAISTLVSIVLLALTPVGGVLVTMMLKPIIDASWNHYFAGINLLRLVGVLVPLLLLPRILLKNGAMIFRLPLAVVGGLYFCSNLFGVMGLISTWQIMGASELFFRVLNGTLGFFMLQTYFNERQGFRNLLIFLLLAGLFPVGVGIFQASTGTVWQERTTVGMVRNVGLYHDAFNIRAYGYQTLTAILLAWSYFSDDRTALKKLALGLYAVLCCFVIFKSYSKAAVAIFIIWTLLWSVLNRKFLWLLGAPVFLIIVNFSTGNQMYQEVETLFSKEIGAYTGAMDDRYVLAGRTIVWEDYWAQWKQKSTFAQFLGSGSNPPTHNEYLRLLYCNGIVGVSLYILIMMTIGMKVLINAMRRMTPLNVMAVMLFSMWMIDTIGLHPGMYPSYQWYVWGFISLALRGVAGLEENTSDLAVAPSAEPERPSWA